jgi:hypothetical protein
MALLLPIVSRFTLFCWLLVVALFRSGVPSPPPHPVNIHLRHVFAKLGVPNRVALAAVAHHLIK